MTTVEWPTAFRRHGSYPYSHHYVIVEKRTLVGLVNTRAKELRLSIREYLGLAIQSEKYDTERSAHKTDSFSPDLH